MIPYLITPEQIYIAELYWDCSWTSLSAPEIQDALDWYYRKEFS